MSLFNRLTKLETTALQISLKRLRENLHALSDSELTNLSEMALAEKVRRGLIDKPEIEAAKGLFEQLTEARKIPAREAAEMVLEAAKVNGFEITVEDFL